MQVEDGALRDFLLGSGLVTRSQLADVQTQDAASLYETLAARGVVSQDELRRAAAHVAGVTFVVLEPHDIPLQTLAIIPEPLARTHNVVAYKQDGRAVEVAMLDLDDLARLDFLRDEGFTVLPRLTTAQSVTRALHRYQTLLKEKFAALMRTSVHAVSALVSHALLARAGSVHLDLRDTGLLVRYRIQGLLHEAMLLPREAAHMFERLKSAANLSLTLHTPQEGRFTTQTMGGEPVRVRVATAPAAAGERITLHLTPEHTPRQGFTLESLGLHGKALDDVHAMLRARSGLIVVAGLAGAGKTTALYTLLDLLGRSDALIATVEEEIQYALPHAVQTSVRPELGLTGAVALRAVLKQDPDIVMVGDVRDADTALVAAGAAARGMLVLVGVEAPSAAGAIERLRAWGVPSLTLAASLQGVIAMEVVQRLCSGRAEEYRLARADSAPLEQPVAGRAGADLGRVLVALKEEDVVAKDTAWKELMFKRAVACGECLDGYQGKVGLHEVLPGTASIKELVRAGASAEDIDKEARGEGMLTLAEDGLYKAAQGITSVEEVLRVA